MIGKATSPRSQASPSTGEPSCSGSILTMLSDSSRPACELNEAGAWRSSSGCAIRAENTCQSEPGCIEWMGNGSVLYVALSVLTASGGPKNYSVRIGTDR